MPRLFWSRFVYRVRKSCPGMIGQLITSFLQGMARQTMTSTIFSPYGDRVMEESKTGYFSGSPGATLGTNRGGIKGGGVSILRTLNDLLPHAIRPIKAKRRRTKKRWGWGVELYTFRRTWHSHRKPRLRKLLNKLQFWKRVS
jgi:hypothetical protein